MLEALKRDDPRIMQGSTTTPPPLMSVQDWPVEGADAIGTVGAFSLGGFDQHANGVKNNDAATVGEVEEFFARACFDADQRIDKPAACRYFLHWFDDTPRDEMRRELIDATIPYLLEKDMVWTACWLVSDLTDAPMDIVADRLEDLERYDLVVPLRKKLALAEKGLLK